eukprot:3931857-Rhodomonas_salina.2
MSSSCKRPFSARKECVVVSGGLIKSKAQSSSLKRSTISGSSSPSAARRQSARRRLLSMRSRTFTALSFFLRANLRYRRCPFMRASTGET